MALKAGPGSTFERMHRPRAVRCPYLSYSLNSLKGVI